MKFYKPQLRIALRNCGFIDPENIGEYIARDGYAALAKVLGMQPDHVLQEIIDSGLRGARRRRFPHRPEVEDHARCESRPQIRGLQRRRRGSGRIHGPFDPRRRSPLDPRSDGHQRLLHGRLARTDLHPRRIPAGHRTAQASHRTGAGIRAAGQRHPGLGLLVRHRAALRRGRLRLRRGDGADSFDGRQTRRTDRETPRTRANRATRATRPM